MGLARAGAAGPRGRGGAFHSSPRLGVIPLFSSSPSSIGRNSDFQKLWAGFTIAVVGSQITVLALPLTAVLCLGAGPTETGLLVAARMAPSLVVGLFVGAWVDRLPRRPIMIGADIGSAVVIGSVPLAAAAGVLGLGQLYVVAFLAGVFNVGT